MKLEGKAALVIGASRGPRAAVARLTTPCGRRSTSSAAPCSTRTCARRFPYGTRRAALQRDPGRSRRLPPGCRCRGSSCSGQATAAASSTQQAHPIRRNGPLRTWRVGVGAGVCEPRLTPFRVGESTDAFQTAGRNENGSRGQSRSTAASRGTRDPSGACGGVEAEGALGAAARRAAHGNAARIRRAHALPERARVSGSGGRDCAVDAGPAVARSGGDRSRARGHRGGPGAHHDDAEGPGRRDRASVRGCRCGAGPRVLRLGAALAAAADHRFAGLGEAGT